jgi:transcriptional regulator with XRE-family HTH domain
MKLKEYLEEQNLTIREFAKLIGISLPSAYQYLKGQARPQRTTMARIIEVTGGKVTYEDMGYVYVCETSYQAPRSRTNLHHRKSKAPNSPA